MCLVCSAGVSEITKLTSPLIGIGLGLLITKTKSAIKKIRNIYKQ